MKRIIIIALILIVALPITAALPGMIDLGGGGLPRFVADIIRGQSWMWAYRPDGQTG